MAFTVYTTFDILEHETEADVQARTLMTPLFHETSAAARKWDIDHDHKADNVLYKVTFERIDQ